MNEQDEDKIMVLLAALWPDAQFNEIEASRWREGIRNLDFAPIKKAIDDHYTDSERVRKHGAKSPSLAAVLAIAGFNACGSAYEYAKAHRRLAEHHASEEWAAIEKRILETPDDELDEWKRQVLQATDEPLAGWLRLRSYIPGDPKYSRTLVAKMMGMMEGALRKAGAA